MTSREEERQRILQACMAVVHKEDKREARDKNDRNRNRNIGMTTDEETFSRSSSVSTPSSTTSSLSKFLAPIIERRNSVKPQDTSEKGKPSILAGKQQKLPPEVKTVKSETTMSGSDEVSTVSYTRSFIPESLQPISELSDRVTEVGSMEEVPEMSNKSFESSKITSVGTASLKSSRKLDASGNSKSSTSKSRTGLIPLKRSPALTSVTQGTSRSRSSDLSSDQVSSLIKSQKLTLNSLDDYPVVEILPPRRKPTSKTSSSSSQVGSFNNVPNSIGTISQNQELTKSARTSQAGSTKTYADSFLSWNSKETSKHSTSSPAATTRHSNKTEASKSLSRLSRSQRFDHDVENHSRTSIESRSKPEVSLRDIVIAEQRLILKEHAGPLPGSDRPPTPKRSMDENEKFMSDLHSELTSIQENFQVVTDSNEEPQSYTDDFLPETLTSRKKKEKPIPKYPVPVPDLELPPFSPPPAFTYAPGLQFDKERWKERQDEPYYGQPYYEPSGRIVDGDSIPPATKFVNNVLNSNARMFYAAIKAAQELGEFNIPRFRGKGKEKNTTYYKQNVENTRPAPFPPRPDTVPRLPKFQENDDPGRGPTSRARLQFEQRRQEAEAERQWFELLHEHRRREHEEHAIPAELDIESLFHEHKRLIKDNERRWRERDRLHRERERREYDRMEDVRRRNELRALRRRAKSSKR